MNYDSSEDYEDSIKDYEGTILSDHSYHYENNYETEFFCE
jgi:hypothetical protein